MAQRPEQGAVLGEPKMCLACRQAEGFIEISLRVPEFTAIPDSQSIDHLPAWACRNCGAVRLGGWPSERKGLPKDFDFPGVVRKTHPMGSIDRPVP